MKTPTPKREAEPPEALRDILDRAVDGGADSIELEYVSEGVEVCFMVGSSGFGQVVDHDEGQEIISFIVKHAGLERRECGTLQVELHGQPCSIRVKTYDHLGEWAYRLTLPTSKPKHT